MGTIAEEVRIAPKFLAEMLQSGAVSLVAEERVRSGVCASQLAEGLGDDDVAAVADEIDVCRAGKDLVHGFLGDVGDPADGTSVGDRGVHRGADEVVCRADERSRAGGFERGCGASRCGDDRAEAERAGGDDAGGVEHRGEGFQAA